MAEFHQGVILFLLLALTVTLATIPPGEDNPLDTHPKRDLLPTVCGVRDTNQVHGGEDVYPGEFPWLALLQYRIADKQRFLCGGFLINKRYVVTAANCVHGRYMPTLVRLGEYDTSTDPDEVAYLQSVADPVLDVGVEQLVAHENYSTRGLQNNIALVRLDRDVPDVQTLDDMKHNITQEVQAIDNNEWPVTWNDVLSCALCRMENIFNICYRGLYILVTPYVQPICLPSPEDDREFTRATNKLEEVGWSNVPNGPRSNVPRRVHLPVVDGVTCADVYKDFHLEVTNRQVCAGGDGNNEDCVGESGSPLMGYIPGGRYLALGIVSHGPRQCNAVGIPTVYTRVAAYLNWILDNMSP